MSELLAINRGHVPVAPAAGLVVFNPMVWDVEAAVNGDTVYVGDLPAFHRIVPEACSLIFDGDAAAMTIDVCVDTDADEIFTAAATLGSAWTRVALSTFEKCYELGVSNVNRKVYFKLDAAPAAAGGKVVVNLAYAPAHVTV